MENCQYRHADELCIFAQQKHYIKGDVWAKNNYHLNCLSLCFRIAELIWLEACMFVRMFGFEPETAKI